MHSNISLRFLWSVYVSDNMIIKKTDPRVTDSVNKTNLQIKGKCNFWPTKYLYELLSVIAKDNSKKMWKKFYKKLFDFPTVA